MADTKITALTALTAADPSTDVLPIVDTSDTTMAASGTTKKISINNILGASGTATLASASITGDLTVDTSTLKVDSANNRVGVGTATPAYPLDVNGNARIGTDGLGFGRLTVSKSTSAAFLNLSLAATSGYTELMFTNFNDNTGATGWSSYIRSNTNAASNYASDLVFGTSAAATGNPIERYKIASDGVATWSNVGGVAGTAMTLNANGLGVGVTPTSTHNLSSAGPIGIAGTNSGTRTSYISNSGACAIYYTDGGGSGFFTDFGNLIIQPRTSAARSVVIATGSTTPVERAVVKSTGQVRFVPLAADPSGAEAGDVYYNSTSNKLKCYNGTTWNDLF